MSQPILPLAVWQSGTNNNSIPANDNALRVEVALKEAISIADSEPAGPTERDLHIVGTPWGGFTTNNAVIYLGGTWLEFESFDGWFKTIAGDLYVFDGSDWNLVTSGGGVAWGSVTGTLSAQTDLQSALDAKAARAYALVTEASAFTAEPGTHDGLDTLTLAGGDCTFDNAEPYTAGMTFPIRATAAIELVEDGVTLTPPAGGTLELDSGMSVQVVMTGATTGIVIGQTVAAS